MITVRKCAFAEIEGHPDFPALHQAYGAECALHGLPPPTEKGAAYRLLDGSAAFQIYGAFRSERLIGFVALLTPVLPHYGVAIAVAESLFVAPEQRKTGAGLQLLHAAETHARALGSPGLLVSAPTGGPLGKVLPRRGYRETNRVFLKVLPHG